MSALDVQVGGDHYKDYAIQPVEFCQRNNLNWCQANVVKYVVRYKEKKGLEDLQKAKHYLDLLIEFEYGDTGQTKPSKGLIGELGVGYKDHEGVQLPSPELIHPPKDASYRFVYEGD